ncbi:hypothetical protein MJD09_08390 [bacterium]|nr:hypothetical protein [bacterium]
MNKKKINLYIGIAFVLVGCLNLLRTLDVIYFQEELIMGGIFLAGAGFLFTRFAQTQRVLVLILASLLAFIGSAIIIGNTYSVDDGFIAVLLMWGASSLFAYGYFRNHRKWGFIIPAGILFTIGLMVFVHIIPDLSDDFLGVLFFLGIACTFGFLYLIRDEQNKLEWAKIPALVLALFSGFIFLVTQDLAGTFLLPLILITVGGYLVFSSTQRRLLKKI